MDQQTGSAAIETYLQGQGYTHLKLSQHWRHLLGTGVKNGTTYFIKMAATKLISPFTRNEAAWNRAITTLAKEKPLSFSVPSVFEDGAFEERFWFSAQYLTNVPLLSLGTLTQTEQLTAHMSHIAHVAKDIMTLSQLAIPNPPEQTAQTMINKIATWEQDISSNIVPLKNFIQERLSSLQFAPAHGDFTPWHMYAKDTTLYLVDNEHARNQAVKFYDVAYFYHRVYTKVKNPTIAEKFLQEFITINPLTDSDKQSLELALAERIVGGYLDAQTDNLTSGELQKELENKLLNNQIY